jgi:hypothetical protein
MRNASASRETVRPTLHHSGLTTSSREAMVGWYEGARHGARPHVFDSHAGVFPPSKPMEPSVLL